MGLFRNRIEQVQEKMRRGGYGFLVLGPSPNMFYFTGLQIAPDERLQLILIPASGAPAAILSAMYAEKAESVIAGSFPVLTWTDRQDPLDLVKSVVKGSAGSRPIAVDDVLRSSHLLLVMEAFPGCAFAPASRVVDSLRAVKDETEIRHMAEAGSLADRVMEIVREEIRPGMTEKELAFFVEQSFRLAGCDDIAFKPIIASGPCAASPHHSPGDRNFREGDFIIVDCGGMVKGYCSDITRTFCLGKATAEMKAVYRAVQEANEKAFAAVSRGCSGEEADRAARDAITAAGYGPQFIHRTGHGIGLEVHEAPYLVEGNREALLPGAVFSIEPGIYLPGSFGVRIEDIVAVTAGGTRRLNEFSRELCEL